jgi:probable phosphoglycerate mutase
VRLVLVRHGEAEVFKRRKIGGPTGCAGLTSLGRAQAEALALRLEASGELSECSALLCSTLPRARETAALLQRALGVQEIVEDCELCELHPGVADGMTLDEYSARYGIFDFVRHPDRPFSPEGETYNEFMRRIRRALDALAMEYADRTVVVVSHGGFVVGSLILNLDIPRPGTGTHLDTANTGLTEWRVSHDGTWTLVRHNDTAHLADLRSP